MEPLRHHNHKNDSKLPSLEMFSASKMSIELDEDNLSESESKSEFEFGMCSTPGSPGSPEKIPNTFPVEEYIVIECFSPDDDDDSPASARISFSAWRNPLYSSNSNSNSSDNSNSNNDNNNNNNSKAFVIDLCSGIRRSMESNTSVMFTRTNSKENNSPSSSDSEEKKFRQKMNRTVSCVSPVGHQSNLSSSSSALPQKNKKMTPLGPSKRWQFIAPAPVLGSSLQMQGMGSNTSRLGMINGFHSGYSNRNSNNNRNNSKNNNNKNGSNKGGFWRRIFKSFVVKCKACHAMQDQDSVLDLDERRF